jgi:hypothetical protein
LALVAALLGAAAFVGALGLKSVQVGKAPADYYGVLSWFAPEIGLAPFAALLGMAALILAVGARDVRSAGIAAVGGGLAAVGLVIALTHAPPNRGQLKMHCMQNIKEIGLALAMYEEDHGALPPATNWTQALSEYVPDSAVWKEPFSGKPGYALNRAIAGRRSDRFAAGPDTVVAVFESDAGANAAGGPELLPRHPRHYGGSIVGYVGGWARGVYGLQSGQHDDESLVWDPDRPPAEPATSHRAGRR